MIQCPDCLLIDCRLVSCMLVPRMVGWFSMVWWRGGTPRGTRKGYIKFLQLDILPHPHFLKSWFFSPPSTLDILPNSLNIIGKMILFSFPTLYSSPQPWYSLPLFTTWYSSQIDLINPWVSNKELYRALEPGPQRQLHPKQEYRREEQNHVHPRRSRHQLHPGGVQRKPPYTQHVGSKGSRKQITVQFKLILRIRRLDK